MKASFALVTLLGLAACASPPPAAPPIAVAPLPAAPAGPAAGGDPFAQIDRNADGGVDQAEWQGLQQLRFGRLDADQNGSLTIAEAQAGGQAGGDRMARLDANGDGAISEQEYVAGQSAIFARIDADGSGAISRAEFDRIAAMANRA